MGCGVALSVPISDCCVQRIHEGIQMCNSVVLCFQAACFSLLLAFSCLGFNLSFA